MKNNVIAISNKRPEQALEHLCRATGLHFHVMPESLVGHANTSEHQACSYPQATVISFPRQQRVS